METPTLPKNGFGVTDAEAANAADRFDNPVGWRVADLNDRGVSHTAQLGRYLLKIRERNPVNCPEGPPTRCMWIVNPLDGGSTVGHGYTATPEEARTAASECVEQAARDRAWWLHSDLNFDDEYDEVV